MRLRTVSALAFLASVSAFAGGISGSVNFQPPISINGVATGPASMVITGDAAKAMYNGMTKVTEYPDSNGTEHERAGDGIVCHKIDATGEALCIIDFTDLSSGSLEHN